MKVTVRNLMGFLLLLTILTTSLTPSTTAMAKGSPSNNRMAVTIPTPISPTGIITDTTPTFKWTRVTGTTKYQFRLYKGASTTPLWTTVVLTSACGSSTLYCTQTPSTPLALANYKWKVRVYTTGSAWSLPKSFSITNIPTSFNSQFTGSMTGWKTIGVIPWHVSPSALITSGTESKCANVYRTSSLAYTNLDYSAKMKCTSSEYCENYLAFRMGQSINPVNNCWFPGYRFGYDNKGYYAIWKALPTGKSILIVNYTYSSLINKQDWNIIRVVAIASTFKFYLNGTLLKTVSDPAYKIGAVGISMWESGNSNLQVDWAKATVLP